METSSSYARRSPRVRCQLPVQLLRRQTPATADAGPVLAQVVDVSRGGIRVQAPLWLDVGEPLECSLTLDGEAARLQGHVAWSSTAGNATGIGISFGELSLEDARRLEDLVRATLPDAQPVELSFEGLTTPIRARAITRPGGIRLATGLPVLTRDAGVVFRYGDDDAIYAGHVAEVAIHEREGARILEVDVEVAPQDKKRFRRHAHYGRVPPLGAAEAAEPAPTPSATARSRNATRPLWQEPRSVSFAARLDAATPEAHAAPRANAAAASAPGRAVSARLRRGLWLAVGAAGAAVVCGAWLLSRAQQVSDPLPFARANAHSAPVAQKQATPLPGVEASPREPAALEPAAAPDTAAVPVAAPAALPGAASTASAARVLQVQERAHEVSVSLPFEGSMEQLVVTRWVEPRAWVLEFPMARTPLADGLYRLRVRGLKTLRVKRTPEGLSLRFQLAGSGNPSPRVSQQPDGLTVTFGSAR